MPGIGGELEEYGAEYLSQLTGRDIAAEWEQVRQQQLEMLQAAYVRHRAYEGWSQEAAWGSAQGYAAQIIALGGEVPGMATEYQRVEIPGYPDSTIPAETLPAGHEWTVTEPEVTIPVEDLVQETKTLPPGGEYAWFVPIPEEVIPAPIVEEYIGVPSPYVPPEYWYGGEMYGKLPPGYVPSPPSPPPSPPIPPPIPPPSPPPPAPPVVAGEWSDLAKLAAAAMVLL